MHANTSCSKFNQRRALFLCRHTGPNYIQNTVNAEFVATVAALVRKCRWDSRNENFRCGRMGHDNVPILTDWQTDWRADSSHQERQLRFGLGNDEGPQGLANQHTSGQSHFQFCEILGTPALIIFLGKRCADLAMRFNGGRLRSKTNSSTNLGEESPAHYSTTPRPLRTDKQCIFFSNSVIHTDHNVQRNSSHNYLCPSGLQINENRHGHNFDIHQANWFKNLRSHSGNWWYPGAHRSHRSPAYFGLQ